MPLSLISVDGQWPARQRKRRGPPQKCRGSERDHMISFGVAATTEAIAAKLSGGERHRWEGRAPAWSLIPYPFSAPPLRRQLFPHYLCRGQQRYEPTPSRIPKGAAAAYGRGELYGQQIPQCLFESLKPPVVHACPELLQLLHFFFMASSSPPRAPRRAGICETVEGRLSACRPDPNME